jgi:glycosyltransferase involved in cell wall biosynthesis
MGRQPVMPPDILSAPNSGRTKAVEGSVRDFPRLKIIFLVTEDWYFWSHRLHIARALQSAGADVVVMTRIGQLRAAMEAEGFRVIPWRISRHSLNPLREWNAFFQVIRAYGRERPDLVHHVALKPIVYGGFAARLCRGIPSVNAVAGLGHVFSNSVSSMRLLRFVLSGMLRVILKANNTKTVFQNDDDRQLLLQEGVVSAAQSIVIRGAGVDIEQFSPRPEPAGVPVVLLASRMLWDKGVGEFVAAAKKLREQALVARFVLVGDPDPENPSAIPQKQLRLWQESGLVELWGHRSEMAAVFSQANLVCLPSYLEGLPKVLIEAAACGRAIVATDVPGCREVVRHQNNGLLVPVRDSDALAEAIALLIKNPPLRARLGTRGREIVVREFSEETILAQTLKVYGELLGSRWPGIDPLLGKQGRIACR